MLLYCSPQFVYSTARGMDCFQFRATMDKATTDIFEYVCLTGRQMHSILLDLHLRVEILGHRVGICLALVDIAFSETRYI